MLQTRHPTIMHVYVLLSQNTCAHTYAYIYISHLQLHRHVQQISTPTARCKYETQSTQNCICQIPPMCTDQWSILDSAFIANHLSLPNMLIILYLVLSNSFHTQNTHTHICIKSALFLESFLILADSFTFRYTLCRADFK